MTESDNNLKINGKAILRDGELFYTRLGIGLFSDEIKDQFADRVVDTNGWRVMWLPGETRQLAEEVQTPSSVMIEGGLGSGKSALLYGLRALYRMEDQPYAHFDGHFLTTPVQIIEKKLDWAVNHNATVTWDSMDYLVGGSRKIRKSPVQVHRDRTTTIVELLTQYMDNGHQLVATTHTESWILKYGDPELIGGIWSELRSRMKTHPVRGILETPEDLIQFYSYAGLTPEEAIYMANLPQDINAKDSAQEVLPFLEGEVTPQNLLREYRIAKLIALDSRRDATHLREELKKLLAGEQIEEEYLACLINFLNTKNRETQQRMGQLAA